MSYTPCPLCGNPLLDGPGSRCLTCGNACIRGDTNSPVMGLPRKLRDLHPPKGNRTARRAFKGIA